jgi:hypothetical protein
VLNCYIIDGTRYLVGDQWQSGRPHNTSRPKQNGDIMSFGTHISDNKMFIFILLSQITLPALGWLRKVDPQCWINQSARLSLLLHYSHTHCHYNTSTVLNCYIIERTRFLVGGQWQSGRPHNTSRPRQNGDIMSFGTHISRLVCRFYRTTQANTLSLQHINSAQLLYNRKDTVPCRRPMAIRPTT